MAVNLIACTYYAPLLLMASELVETEPLQEVQEEEMTKKIDFVSFLIDQELIKSQEIGQLVANNLHVKYVNLAKENIKPEILTQLPEIVARKQKMLIFIESC